MFSKKLGEFLEKFGTFFKNISTFSCRGRWNHPSPIRSFLLFPSSLHFNQNTLAVKWLKMTVHPFILVSAVLPKSLHNLPSKHTMQAVYSYTSFQPAVFCRNRPVCLPGNSSLQAIGAIRRTHGSAPTVNESAIEKVKKQFPLFTNERRLKER